MTNQINIADLREKLAASESNPGRWHWAGNTDTQNIYLATWRSGFGRCTVMDFARWGMQRARPRFTEDLMLVDGDKRVVYEVAPNAADRLAPEVYRADIVGIRHPDAALIVAAVNALPALLDELEQLRTVTPEQEDRAEREATRILSRLSKRDDWAEDDTAVGGQAAHIVRVVLEASRQVGGDQ